MNTYNALAKTLVPTLCVGTRSVRRSASPHPTPSVGKTRFPRRAWEPEHNTCGSLAFRRFVGLSLFLTTLIAPVAAAEPDALAKLDQALKAVPAFEYGKDAAPMLLVEQIVIESAKDAKQREAIEQRLLAVFDGNPTRDGKEFVCRQLFIIGTARAVPRLEPMLTDPAVAHMARFALGRIEAPEASAALVRAIGKTSGKLQVGVINTLASRGCREALPEIIKLLASPDAAVADAAVAALGALGGREAAQALEPARGSASPSRRQGIDDARMACADGMLRAGQRAEAAEIYQQLMAAEMPRHVQIGALRGLVHSRGPAATGLLVDAIKQGNPHLRACAIGLARGLPGPETTQTLVGLLPSLGPDAQELLLRALGERGDTSAAPAIMVVAKSEQPALRLAAIEALAGTGDATAVPLLARLAVAAAGEEQQMARASLVRLKGDAINDAILRAAAADATLRTELIRALAGRRATTAFGPLTAMAADADPAVRREAIAALGALAGESDLPALIALAVHPKDAAERPLVEQAATAAVQRVRDPQKRASPLLSALGGAPAEARPALVRLLKLAATPEALGAVRAALKDGNEAIRDAGVRTLAEWPDANPLADLLDLARNAPQPGHKVLALRGYVRLAGLTENPTALYTRAMELAQRVEDKKLVLAGLGTASTIEALELVEKSLSDASLAAEAGLAMAQIADRLRQANAPRARAAVDKVLATVQDPHVRQQAQNVVNEIEQFEGYLLNWLVSPMYKAQGADTQKLFDAAQAPETAEAATVAWKPLNTGVGPWSINLEGFFGAEEHCAAYVRTRVWVSAAQDARLEMGSDDCIKAWLNGKAVHTPPYYNRSMAPRQDIVAVKLQAGWNDLMLKVVDHEGGWAFCCRLRRSDGSALADVKVEAK
jgi:HEAT repeat protein